jgi:spermidine/putrescine transport system substrate-binding protein
MSEIQGSRVRYLNRRQFLHMLGAAAASISAARILTACSPGDAPGDKVGGQLDFFSWEGYDMLDATKTWREEHGVELKSGYIASSDDTAAKILGPGGAGIDLITYYHGYSEQWRDMGVFGEFSADEVPEIKSLYPFFQEGEWWQIGDGKYIGVPLMWLTLGMNYRKDLIEKPQRWTDLLDDKFKGKIAMVEDPTAAITTAAIVLGFDPGKMRPNELGEVKSFLLSMKANSKTIAPSYGDLSNLLVSGEVVATYVGWAAINAWAAADGVEVGCVDPDDGVMVSVDAYAIPTTTDNRATALAWVNLMLTKEVQAAGAEGLMMGVVRPDAVSLIKDESIRDLYSYDDVQGFFEKNRPSMVAPAKSDEYVTYSDWLKMWEEVKAG